jgi:clan AA aspartic protease
LIRGEVTADNEAVVTIRVLGPTGQTEAVRAVIDTGFTEFLCLPPEIVNGLTLPFDSTVTFYLAGDTPAEFDQYIARVEWDGEVREVIAVKGDGVCLIGISLLRGKRLGVDCIDGGPVLISTL